METLLVDRRELFLQSILIDVFTVATGQVLVFLSLDNQYRCIYRFFGIPLISVICKLSPATVEQSEVCSVETREHRCFYLAEKLFLCFAYLDKCGVNIIYDAVTVYAEGSGVGDSRQFVGYGICHAILSRRQLFGKFVVANKQRVLLHAVATR